MKITRVTPIAVGLPMKKPVKMAGVEIARADNVLVRLESDSGIVGWGEAAAAPTMTGETVGGMMAALGLIAPVLLGRTADDIADVLGAMDRTIYANKAAKAAAEMALHDLLGRARGVPVHALLGHTPRARMPVMATIGTGSAEGAEREARALRALGYVAFKIKVGSGTPEADAARTTRLREVLGADCTISADANMGWSVEEAIRFARAAEEASLAYFEQPVTADDLAGMAKVAAGTRLPIGADEGIHALADIARHHAAGAAKGAALKTIKLGGMRGVMAGGAACARLGMAINVSGKTGESSIASAAAVHLGAVLPSLDWGLSIACLGLAEDVISTPVTVKSGHVCVSDAPGLGVDVDEARVRKFALRP